MMLEEVDKQVDVVQRERQFLTQAMEDGVLNTELIANHQFEPRFPAKNKKIKEANELNIEAYDSTTSTCLSTSSSIINKS